MKVTDFGERTQVKVLIAEDDAVTRLMLQRGVSRLGHETVTAEDGQAAWEHFLAGGIDVVISDWAMPRLDGLELCRRIRAECDRPYAYVIVQSVMDDAEHAIRGMQAGADDYLVKPFHPDDLEARLIAAERVTSLHGRLRERALAGQERAQLQGVLLASHTIQHEMNNHLAIAAGYAECLVADPSLPSHLREMADLSVQGMMAAAEVLARLQRVARVKQQDWGDSLPSTLDLSASTT